MELRFTNVPVREKLAFIHHMVDVVEQNSSWLRYATSEPENVNPVILHRLAEHNLPVLSLSKMPQSLETVYLRVLEEDPEDGKNE